MSKEINLFVGSIDEPSATIMKELSAYETLAKKITVYYVSKELKQRGIIPNEVTVVPSIVDYNTNKVYLGLDKCMVFITDNVEKQTGLIGQSGLPSFMNMGTLPWSRIGETYEPPKALSNSKHVANNEKADILADQVKREREALDNELKQKKQQPTNVPEKLKPMSAEELRKIAVSRS